MADIQRSLGRIEQKIDSHVKAFDEHVEMDRKAYKTLFDVSKAQAKQKGFISGAVAVAGAIGGVAGVALHKLLGH